MWIIRIVKMDCKFCAKSNAYTSKIHEMVQFQLPRSKVVFFGRNERKIGLLCLHGRKRKKIFLEALKAVGGVVVIRISSSSYIRFVFICFRGNWGEESAAAYGGKPIPSNFWVIDFGVACFFPATRNFSRCQFEFFWGFFRQKLVLKTGLIAKLSLDHPVMLL